MGSSRALAFLIGIVLSGVTGAAGYWLNSGFVTASQIFDQTRLRFMALGWVVFGWGLALVIRTRALHPLAYGITAGVLILTNIPLFFGPVSIEAWSWLAFRVGGAWSLICAGVFAFAAVWHQSPLDSDTVSSQDSQVA